MIVQKSVDIILRLHFRDQFWFVVRFFFNLFDIA